MSTSSPSGKVASDAAAVIVVKSEPIDDQPGATDAHGINLAGPMEDGVASTVAQVKLEGQAKVETKVEAKPPPKIKAVATASASKSAAGKAKAAGAERKRKRKPSAKVVAARKRSKRGGAKVEEDIHAPSSGMRRSGKYYHPKADQEKGVPTVVPVNALPLLFDRIMVTFSEEEANRVNAWAVQNALVAYAMMSKTYVPPEGPLVMMEDLMAEVHSNAIYAVPFVRMDKPLLDPSLAAPSIVPPTAPSAAAVDAAAAAASAHTALQDDSEYNPLLPPPIELAAARSSASTAAAAAASPAVSALNAQLSKFDKFVGSKAEARKRSYRATGDYERKWTVLEVVRFVEGYAAIPSGATANRRIAEHIGTDLWSSHVARIKRAYKKDPTPFDDIVAKYKAGKLRDDAHAYP